MTPVASDKDSSPDWIQPAAEQQGISRYVETLRERIWLIVICVVVTTAVAAAYVFTTAKTYQAEADVLVTPVPVEAETLISVGLISRSAEPLREIETVARLITTNEVADQALTKLQGLPEAASSDELLTHISADPVADSNIVAVTATASSAESAAQIANVFVRSAIAQRTHQLHARVKTVISQLTAELNQNPPDRTALANQISELHLLESGQDPTIGVASVAQTPTGPISPRPTLSIVGGIIAGLILGIGGAFAYQTLDPRLRREEQLRRLYRLPILARIPRESSSTSDTPLPPASLSPAATEAYRTLRGTLSAAGRRTPGRGRVVLVTSSSASEGKTTTAINLATSLAIAGKRVIMIESDLRRPAIKRVLGLEPRAGVVSVLAQTTPLTEALVTTETYGEKLGLLLADTSSWSGWMSELFSLPATAEMIDEARSIADFVIIDSPPLTDVIDALPLTSHADDVLVVVRLGKTKLDKLTQLGELLAENDIRPVGFAVIGTSRPSRSDYTYYSATEESPLWRRPTVPSETGAGSAT